MGSVHLYSYKQTVTKNKQINMKVLLLCSVLSLSLSHPQSGVPYPKENEIPQPYNYQYGVKDDYTQANFAKTESQDDRGNVKGTFVISLPDGRIQTTTYTADPVQGFIAEVTYQGEPVYPEPKPYNANNPKNSN